MKFFYPFCVLLLASCKEKQAPVFGAELTQATPWSYIPSPPPKGSFSFAIIGDLNSGERAHVLEVAAEQIQLLRPEFVLSIGDLVEGGTEDTLELQKQYNHFDERMAKAKSPVFHLGGNHDLTNPVMQKFWEHRYGKRYYHFIYQNVLFLMLDSEDYPEERMWQIYHARAKALQLLDAGKREEAEKTEYFQMPERATGEISEEQSAYFEKVIADHPNVRWTFVLMHKPVWQRQEPKGFAKIETALGTRDYTVLNGHLHKYSYQLRNGRDYIMVATTGGGQDPKSDSAFDHIMLVTMRSGEPSILNLRLEGMLDKTGHVPLGGDSLCFQASKCLPNKTDH
ncbi:MAG: metallophosphoesterase family protein [Cytophagales bacterium]